MFENAGSKIKQVSGIVTTLGIVLSVVLGVIFGLGSSGIGFLIITPIGCLASWLGGLLLHGFGELIEYTHRIADKVDPPAEENAAHHEGWTCPHCGTKNLLGNAKCTHCGKS